MFEVFGRRLRVTIFKIQLPTCNVFLLNEQMIFLQSKTENFTATQCLTLSIFTKHMQHMYRLVKLTYRKYLSEKLKFLVLTNDIYAQAANVNVCRWECYLLVKSYPHLAVRTFFFSDKYFFVSFVIATRTAHTYAQSQKLSLLKVYQTSIKEHFYKVQPLLISAKLKAVV